MYRVLYVDDDPFLLQITKEYLEESQVFIVDTIASAADALKREDLSSYDAILSDYEMPGMNGIAFLKKIRAESEDLPFILFTGKGREEIVIEAINNGADFYLQKGGNPEAQFAELSHKLKIAAERRRSNVMLKEDEFRLTLLLNFYQMSSVPLRELMTYAIEEATKLTASSVGYLAFVNDNETVLTMYAWSSSATKACSIHKKPVEYPLETTGLWGEAVRQRAPVITNDYHAPNPLKKGLPAGHVPLQRHMNIPVFEGSQITMVAGVGNKSSDYTERDVQNLTILMNGLWNVIKQRKAEESLRTSEETFRCLVEHSSNGVVLIDEDGRIREWNNTLSRITGISRKEAVGNRYLDVVLPLLQVGPEMELKKERITTAFNHALKTGESDYFYQWIHAVIQCSQGQRLSLEHTIFPIKTERGFRIGSIVREITDTPRIIL